MSAQTLIPQSVNPDLQKERNAADFNVEEFAAWWLGGADKLKLKRDLENFMFKDYDDQRYMVYYLTHEQVAEQSVKQAIEIAKKLKAFQALHNPGGKEIWPGYYTSIVSWSMVPMGNPYDVQFGLVLTALRTQCTDEQYQRIGKRVENFEVGCAYAQTELGHGTYLRGLETRADYDRSTQEFVMNTPKITSYKWWPGGLAHSSNYALVIAQLYIDNIAKGVYMFWVQVRDEETHMPLPGVDIGDIGKKSTATGMNNGFLGLKNVRIPRENMFMRNAQVLPDGTFVKSSDSVLTYFALVFGRVFVAHSILLLMAKSAIIATRYSAVRRQCPINSNEREVQIIDHVTQQMKLFPEIATVVAIQRATEYLKTMYEATAKDVQAGDATGLSEMHAFSCILKVLSTMDSSSGAERLRLACGGHGHMMSAGLATVYLDTVSGVTVEGENTVLLLQVGRFLIKSWRHALAREPLPHTVAFLAEYVRNPEISQWSASRVNIVKALQYAAGNKIRLAYKKLMQRMEAGQSMGEAANNTGLELVQAAELYGRSLVCLNFLNEICGANAASRSASLNRVLENLLDLYLVHTAFNQLSHIMRVVQLTDADICELQDWLEQCLTKIRPNAVAICDGFDFRDISINSTLGCYDGNVYERIFQAAKDSPLNKKPVHDIFHTHMRPFFKSNM